jgi:Tol biopolymer transport system component
MDIFVRDLFAGTTERVSVDSASVEGNGDCWAPSISRDGRYVAFESGASNLVPGDTNFSRDIFVRDRQAGTTERVSVSSAGVEANHLSQYPSITPDGRYIVFASAASNIVPADTNSQMDVFLRDRQANLTERISISTTELRVQHQAGTIARPL